MRKSFIICFVISMCLLILVGCSKQEEKKDIIIETNYQQYDEFEAAFKKSLSALPEYTLFQLSDVELDDGKFEVILVQWPTSLVQLNEITMALLNRTFDAPGLNYFKTSHLEIESEEEMSWTLDGEFGGNHKTVNIENKQKALSIMVNWDKDHKEDKVPEEK